MRGLFFCLVTVTVILFPMNVNRKIFEMDNALGLKWNDACLYFAILVAFDSKAEVKRQAKPRSLETSRDKKERQAVVEERVPRGTSGNAHQLTWMLYRRVPTTSGVLRDLKRNGNKSPVR